jgi:hypothetical protein
MERREIEAQQATARPRLPEPAGPPEPNPSHPKAGFYRMLPYCSPGGEETGVSNSGTYL